MLKLPDLRHYFGWSNSIEKFTNNAKRDSFLALVLGDPETKRGRKIVAAIDLRKVPLIIKNTDALRSLEDPNESFDQALQIAETADRKLQVTGTLAYIRALVRNLAKSITTLNEQQRKTVTEIRQALNDLLEGR
jgi:hypothetical protein